MVALSLVEVAEVWAGEEDRCPLAVSPKKLIDSSHQPTLKNTKPNFNFKIEFNGSMLNYIIIISLVFLSIDFVFDSFSFQQF